MYTITFYSFKGGVGRTLALVNVAAELAKMGRKVLLVDFDLEAPGLETYERLRPPKPHPGIVEYVTEYRRTMNGPDVHEYIYEAAPVGKRDGRLWVMPAGRRDANYQKALINIDWKKLYAEEDGFLLFEDAKAQWEQDYKADYVLIDSRTGHTDVEGICTRQLPDSVVLMFMPNEQNLAGLEGVARAIRSEETEGLKKSIRLHFVASNVPDLDDEKRILDRQMRAFRNRLGFKNLSGLIRRYESLSLLNQSIFTVDRPRTKLARTYQRLAQTLLKDNFADREGAMTFLEDYAKLNPASRPPDKSFTPEEFFARFPEEIPVNVAAKMMYKHSAFLEYDEPAHEIIKHFSNDIEVLKRLAEYSFSKEDYGNAISVLDRVLELRPELPDSLLLRASCKIQLIETKLAADDLLSCLRYSDQDPGLTDRCLKRLREIAPHRLPEAADILSAQGYPGTTCLDVVEFLCDTETAVPRAAQLLRDHLATLADEEKAKESGKLVGLLLRTRCWKETIQLLKENGTEELNAGQLFHLALAYWGEKAEMPETLCRSALEQSMSSQEFGDSAYGFQAKSWLYWRTGSGVAAIKYLDKAEEFGRGEEIDSRGSHPHITMHHTGVAFSMWRYRFVSIEQFLNDCGLMRRMIQGEPIRPAFLGESPKVSKPDRLISLED